MSSEVSALDFLIQDFISTNVLNKENYRWSKISHRDFVSDGAKKILHYTTSDNLSKGLFAIAEYLILPHEDILRIILTIPKIPVSAEFRFNYLQLMSKETHNNVSADCSDPKNLLIRVTTKHRGHLNVVFVIREGTLHSDPILIA